MKHKSIKVQAALISLCQKISNRFYASHVHEVHEVSSFIFQLHGACFVCVCVLC